MTRFSPLQASLLALMAFLAITTGCATTSDIENLNKDLTRKLERFRTDLSEELARAIHNSAQQAVNQTLLSNYTIEEAALRERLKAVTQARERLESVTVQPQAEVRLSK